MSIQMVSISHKTAPLKVRELFAFGADEQILILEILNKHPLILESVMIATCNRTEIYVYSEEKHHSKEIFELIQQTLKAMPIFRIISDFIMTIKPSGICLRWHAVWIPW